MHEAIRQMLARHDLQTQDKLVHALRETLQELALLGLWRAKFFEHAAFYGGTALRVLHGLDRFSEDLDFSLLHPEAAWSFESYGNALVEELASFGFRVRFEPRVKKPHTQIESAFLKTDTLQQLIELEADAKLLKGLHPGVVLRLKLEVDTDPPPGFRTELRYLSHPSPFPVRAYALPDLFAGKLHAVLFRHWGSRVKGRDWYDFAWYAGRHPAVKLRHLEQRMRQSGDLQTNQPLDLESLKTLLRETIARLDLDRARKEVEPFVRDPRSLAVWSKAFFNSMVERIQESKCP